MHKNYVITDLHIPSNLLQDNRFTLEEKVVISLENQYPKIIREDIASIMKTTTRQVSNHRRSINKKLREEINFPNTEETFSKEEENFPNEEINKIEKKKEENFSKPETNFSKREININSVEHKKNVQKVIKFLNGITTQEIYDEKQSRIREIWTHTDMFTQEEFDKFDEILSEKVQNFQEY